MGHAIDYGFLDADNKAAAMREGLEIAYDWAYYNGDRMEGSDNYHGNFKFYDKRFDNEDEAMDFFYRMGTGTDGIVMVRAATEASRKRCSERVARYRKKIEDLNARRLEEFKKRKSKTVGCKRCGNRVDNETALRHHLICPSCREPFGGEGYKKRLQAYKDKIEESYARLKRDTSESGRYRYFYKVDVHC